MTAFRIMARHIEAVTPFQKPKIPKLFQTDLKCQPNVSGVPTCAYILTLSKSAGLQQNEAIRPTTPPDMNFQILDESLVTPRVLLTGSYKPNLRVEYTDSLASDAYSPLYIPL